ncbi:MAG: glycosyltransferase [Muribaculaceae bacterium]|nr:glycosyltransferase [Muribaculaceae bacterium]
MTTFSIITVCYNAADTIERTVVSVDSQTYTDYEHIIIDGASKDNTVELVARHNNGRRTLWSEPDKGLYDAMNKGISRSSGKYLIFLNAGDKFHAADTLATIASLAEDNNFPGIIYGQTDIVDNDGRRIGTRHLSAPAHLTLQSFADGMVVCHQSFVALRRISGFYNTDYRYSADYEWCIRCLQHSRSNVGLTDTVFIDYLSQGITTRHKLPSLLERFRIMAYYYGFLTATVRHIAFIPRWWKRHKNNSAK